MKCTSKILLSIILILIATSAASQSDSAEGKDEVVGTWQTESSKKGYLHVLIEPCGDALCGKIVNAYTLEGEVSEGYEHVGKQMLWDMKARGDGLWTKGKIWDPSKDKTYKSKMSLNGDTLSVSGCVLIVCRSQDWTRVK